MTRVIIVGTGISGFVAAETLRSLNPQTEIVLVSDDPHGFYSRPGLAYYLAGEIPENKLYLFSINGRFNLDIDYINSTVTHLDPIAHKIETTKSGRLNYDQLLLATGASAVPLLVPGADLQGLVKLDNLEDTRQILSLVKHIRNAVVVGGGVVGVELVEGLLTQGVKVHYLLRGDRYWPNILSEDESRIIERHLEKEGVTIHRETEILEIIGKHGQVKGARTSKGNILPCEMVAVGIGVKPRMELAQSAGLKTDRGIRVNEYLQTSNPDIYATGDVAQIHDPVSGRSSIDDLWYPGRKQGRVAAFNMAGHKQAYQRTVAVNVLRLAGVLTTIIGAIGIGRSDEQALMTRGSSETWQQLPNTLAAETGTEVNHLRLAVGEKTLLGALVMGSQKISRPIREMINNRMDITAIRGQLMQSGDQLGKTLMDYWLKNKESGGKNI